MALINCSECQREMSAEALVCPGCGKPNATAQIRADSQKQGVGCMMVILGGLLAFFFWPIAGAILAIIGVVLILANIRLR